MQHGQNLFLIGEGIVGPTSRNTRGAIGESSDGGSIGAAPLEHSHFANAIVTEVGDSVKIGGRGGDHHSIYMATIQEKIAVAKMVEAIIGAVTAVDSGDNGIAVDSLTGVLVGEHLDELELIIEGIGAEAIADNASPCEIGDTGRDDIAILVFINRWGVDDATFDTSQGKRAIIRENQG